MGVRKLKIKTDLNYRPGYTHSYCGHCNSFVHGPEPRCKIIGLEPGRLYKINPGYICDKFDGSEHLKRIRGY